MALAFVSCFSYHVDTEQAFDKRANRYATRWTNADRRVRVGGAAGFILNAYIEVPKGGQVTGKRTPAFITEIALEVCPSQEKQLLTRLDVARQVYKACLGESLKRLSLLRQSKAYQAARRQAKTGSRAFRQANAAVGFGEYDLHAYAAQFNHAWTGEHLDINTISSWRAALSRGRSRWTQSRAKQTRAVSVGAPRGWNG